MSFAKKLSIKEIDGKKGLFIPLEAIEREVEEVDEGFGVSSIQCHLAYAIEEASLDGEVSDVFVEMAGIIKKQAEEYSEAERLLQKQFNEER